MLSCQTPLRKWLVLRSTSCSDGEPSSHPHPRTRQRFVGLGLACPPTLADIVVVVSAKSPVTNFARDEVRDIFLGKGNRFPDGQPAPTNQVEGSSDRGDFGFDPI